MTYREFTDEVLRIVGNVNWGMLGRLANQYKLPYILECVDKVEDNIRDKTPTSKTQYIAVVCRKYATDNDMITDDKIDWSKFD